ncbi:hydroxymethylbilane synthase [Nocardioides bizhenqiangii]|uniref:Porphobilinogen deaminase n=1 Tax=Nocardioides bizhenqiangii TaxID=3095076 RepID=A0ABZ0ZRK1_9ACTN|nr:MULTISPECIES: hydroxymethylbilane synthase [unclassified Nocardioides]MDZ5622701.1 hydroxymethylbilane synthase [Nocardioides sp. HM23]WQQ26968.1 hydroxymethylbilane synthase [Nocardioides sp. HM61]
MTIALRTVRVGTRRSLLATTQAEQVAALLRERLDVDTELVEVTTDGDRSQAAGTPLQGSSTGVFVGALRDALLAGEVDLAVHSLKDLPTYPEPGVVIAAIPPREDPRDVVVARDGLTLGELPAGSVVGTGSPRRAAQINALGLGLDVVGIRGNVDTRIGKVRAGECDAVVLARAGLARIGRLDEVSEVLDPLQMLPAPGQGALAVECRSDDPLAGLVAVLDDPMTHAAVLAERTTLATLEGGCSAPIGALADVAEGDHGPELWLRAVALSPDGSLAVRRSATAPLTDRAAAAALGARLAQEMLADGAGQLDSAPEPAPTHAPTAGSTEVHNA